MATYDDLEEWIRTESDGDDSVDDQVITAAWFWNRDITALKDRVARTNQVDDHIGHRLEYQTRTILDNLEEIGVLLQIDPPGSGQYIRNHRTGENFYDPRSREFVPVLEEDLSRLIEDLRTSQEQEAPIANGGNDEDTEHDEDEESTTLRDVAAETLEVSEGEVEDELTDPDDPIERMNRYDSVVKAIKNSEHVSRTRNYDEMGWRNSALRWTLSELGEAVEANESLPA